MCKVQHLFFYFLLSLAFSCGNSNKETPVDRGDPLSGDFAIATDPAYFPLVQVLSDTYMGLYPLVNIRIDTTRSGNPYGWMVDSTLRMMVTGIPLKEQDSIAMASRGVFVNISPFAKDALVMVHQQQNDTASKRQFELRHDSCFRIMNLTPSAMITDRSGSENNYYLANRLSTGCLSSWKSTNGTNELMEQVASAPGVLGLVSWSYLCERKSKRVKERLSRMEIVPYADSTSERIYPSQSTIVTGAYPLTRTLFMVTSEPFAGPATGFAAWVASSEGQRVIRLFGGAPLRIPPREIEISN